MLAGLKSRRLRLLRMVCVLQSHILAALTVLEPMRGMSEDEGDVDDQPEVKVDEEKNEAARKAREERQEKLRKMMEDDGKLLHSPAQLAANVFRRRYARCTHRSRVSA